MSKTSEQAFIASLLNAQGNAVAPLDAAAEYMRSRFDRVVGWYVLAMVPHAIFALMLTQSIAGEFRADFPLLCIAMTAATVWRWIGLALLQRDVQSQLHHQLPVPILRKLPAIILVRLYSSLAVTWGSLLIIPGFYGLFMGSFAAPLLLESNEPLFKRVRKGMGWIGRATGRLVLAMLSVALAGVSLLVGVLVLQHFVVALVLPSLLGLDSAGVTVTTESWAWLLGLFYFVFLLVDCFWSVAAVFLYYDSQSRRMATDLRARLDQLKKEAA